MALSSTEMTKVVNNKNASVNKLHIGVDSLILNILKNSLIQYADTGDSRKYYIS